MRESKIVFDVTEDGFLTAQRELDKSRRGSFWKILTGLLKRIVKREKINH